MRTAVGDLPFAAQVLKKAYHEHLKYTTGSIPVLPSSLSSQQIGSHSSETWRAKSIAAKCSFNPMSARPYWNDRAGRCWARDQRQFIFYCRCAYGSAFWQPACYFALAHRPLKSGTWMTSGTRFGRIRMTYRCGRCLPHWARPEKRISRSRLPGFFAKLAAGRTPMPWRISSRFSKRFPRSLTRRGSFSPRLPTPGCE